MEAPEYFDNVTIGQFVLTGVPVKVYVHDRYLYITDPDDVSDPLIGYGMDENGEMDMFNYKEVNHLLVSGNYIDLETYKNALKDDESEEPEEEESEENAEEEESSDEEEGEDTEQKEENIMKRIPTLAEIANRLDEGAVETLIDVLINAGWLSLFFAGSVAHGDILGFRRKWKNNRLRKQAIKKMAANPKIMKAAKAEDLEKFGYLMTTTLTDDELSAISFDDMKSGKTMRQVGGMSEQKKENIMKRIPTLAEIANQLDEAYLPNNVKGWVKERGPESYRIANKVAGWVQRLGKRIGGGTAVGKYYSTLVLDIKYQGSEIRIDLDTDEIEFFGQPVRSFNEFKAVWEESPLSEITKAQKDARVASAKADMDAAKEKEMNAKREKVTESMLTEGQFSWMTHNTGKQIGSEPQNTISVTMYDDEGNEWNERNYEGYGEFGGKDYYELMAEMNGYTEEDIENYKGTFKELRSIGIDLYFGKMEPRTGEPVVYPALIEDEGYFNWRSHDFTEKPEDDPNQSWYQEEEDDRGPWDYDEEDDYYNESVKLNEAIDINRWKKIANIKK